MFKINYIPSKSHWIMPPIVIGILCLLGIIMFVQYVLQRRKDGKEIICLNNYSFFKKNWDKRKLLGTLLMFILYIKSMEYFGFVAASIVFIFLFNVIFAGIEKFKGMFEGIKSKEFYKNKDFKSIINSAVISIVFVIGVWVIFGQIFQITLP